MPFTLDIFCMIETFRQWALKAYKELGDNSMVFKASRKWIYNFEKAHRIVSRKVTMFITRKTLEDKEVLKTKATEFVNEINPLVARFGPENLYNSEQSGLQLEIHSGRTLAIEGTRKVECTVVKCVQPVP